LVRAVSGAEPRLNRL